MDFYVMVKSHDCYGGHTTLSPIGRFLLKGGDHFGDAIREIVVTLHLRDSGPARKTLESLLERHNQYRATLPKITFRRAKGKLEIDVASELMDAREWKPSPKLSLPLFSRGVDEVVQALGLMSKRLKSTDDFRLEAFINRCNAAKTDIPESEDLLQDLAKELEAIEQAKRAAMSPWEKLGVDWADFHPDARGILDETFFWDCTNDFSPNGNDTGSDLLSEYRDWLKRHKDGKTISFLENLAKKWGYESMNAMDDDVLCEACVGLAFADVKLRATCDQDARQLAFQAIERQRAHAQDAKDWPHRDERLIALNKIEAKLRQTAAS